VTFPTALVLTRPGPLLWLPLPGSNADLFAMTFFLGIVGIVAWNIYYSNPK